MVQSGRRARPNPKAQDEQAQVIERKGEASPLISYHPYSSDQKRSPAPKQLVNESSIADRSLYKLARARQSRR